MTQELESIWGSPDIWKRDPKNEHFERTTYDKIPDALKDKIEKKHQYKTPEPIEGYKASVWFNERYDMFEISRWKSGGNGQGGGGGKFFSKKTVIEAPNQIYVVDQDAANRLFMEKMNGKDGYWKVIASYLPNDPMDARVMLQWTQRMEF